MKKINYAKHNNYKKILSLILVLLYSTLAAKTNKQTTTKQDLIAQLKHKHIIGNSLDEIVLQGIAFIKENGTYFDSRSGSGQQAYNVSYTLTNPRNRLHHIRKPISIKYFCRELLAYFNGSLNVDEGLAQASTFWKTLADENNQINSNYGYYVFHQKVPEYDNKTQYEWCIQNLKKNIYTRKAFININQPWHKNIESKDFPCTIGMQFFVKDNYLCCIISSRSTDIFTGLPYDLGFFSFVTELLYQDLKKQMPKDKNKTLKLGYVTMKTNFTQIYNKTREKALKLLQKEDKIEYNNTMPKIENAQEVLIDIYNKTYNTPIMKWIKKYAKM